MRTGRGTPPRIWLSRSLSASVQDGKVKDANITGTDVQGTLDDGTAYHTTDSA